ncbi:MAG: hypothetical protein WCB68_14710 [Pyrinomonadaceae bacterium]
MAKDQTKRLPPNKIVEDEELYAALKGITGYQPANAAYSMAAIDAAYAERVAARQNEVQADVALATARDNTVAKDWEFHNLMLGAKDQVTAQFGRNSDQIQAMKLKKTSEYKAPQRKKKGDGDKG